MEEPQRITLDGGSREKIQEFLRRRDKAVMDFDVGAMRQLWQDMALPPVSHDHVLEITMHKLRACLRGVPSQVKQESIDWLEERGYSPSIDMMATWPSKH